jgi:hypothetical protein
MEVFHILHESVLERGRAVGLLKHGAVGVSEDTDRVICSLFSLRCCGRESHRSRSCGWVWYQREIGTVEESEFFYVRNARGWRGWHYI